MNKIKYPDRGSVEFATIVAEYKDIFPEGELAQMEIDWQNWKEQEGVTVLFPETVNDLLTADTDVLALVYERFKSIRRRIPLKTIDLVSGKKKRNPKLVQLDKIFRYTNKYDDNIAAFFIDHADYLHISSCYYCETAYINVFKVRRRIFDVDHYIPKEKCPILGLSLFNFVPSCQVCNSRIKLAKEIGRNRTEYEKFNPAGGYYDFDDKVKIRLRMKEDFKPNLNNPSGYYIYFRCKDGFRKEVDFFHLTERYEFHKMEAIRIKKLKQQYPQSAIRKISKILGYTEAQVNEDLFHEHFLKDNHRCFAKLTSDMLK
jgi:hypothetical protein